MGFDDMLNKGKDYAKDHQDQVDQGIDTASQKAQDAAPDQADEHIRQAGEVGKDQIQDRLNK